MKYKCLFLQGNSMIGKSTLIIDAIQPFLSVTTGFMSQRLMTNGETRGFCLTPIELAASSITEYNPAKPNIFLENINGKWQRHEEVFRTAGVELLSDLAGKQLVVLDEIGGMELLEESFRKKLYEVLSSGIPCIGVIKSYNNKARMQENVDIEQEYTILHRKLYSDIENNLGGVILDANGNDLRILRNSVQTFLNSTVKII